MGIPQILLYSVILIPYFLNVLIELLNLSYLSNKVPQEFQKLYEPHKYKKSQEYLRLNTKFGLIESTVQTALLLMFIMFGGFNIVDTFARDFSLSEIVSGVLFLVILLILSKLASLPFDIYKTFIIEQKFGFNKVTPQVFVVDFFKSLALESILGGLIFAIIIGIFESLGNSAWFVAWLAVTIIQLIIMFVYPVVIMPLFNKFVPLKKGLLKTEIELFAKKQNFVLNGIFTMDGSKRSTRANAFFTGFGRFRRIVLFDTLIKQHTNQELVAILAHEIGHYKKHHIIKQLIASCGLTLMSFFILGQLNKNPIIFNAFQVDSISTYASLIFISLFAQPLFLVTGIAIHYLTRKYEYEADQFAVDTYRKPKVLIEALKKLTVKNLSNLHPHPLKVMVEYSHPPILERIRAIKK